MATLDRPLVRPLAVSRVEHRGKLCAAFDDSLGLLQGQVLIPIELYQLVVRQFDGTKTLEEIRTQILDLNGQDFPIADLEKIVEQLDRAMVLDGPTFAGYSANYRKLESRTAALAGRSYSSDPSKLKAELASYFERPKGAGPIGDHDRSRPLRAVICPHIDFSRGGHVYSWAYRELVEKSDAEVFVILGVAHQFCKNRFALTRKDFETPLGKVTTNRKFVDAIAKEAGKHLLEDELSHRTEHSIEFQAVFLQYLLGGRRDFSIVPILVGSFHDLMARKVDPIRDLEVARMVEALKNAEAMSSQKVAYIGAIDLCHVGPEFGDPSPVDDSTLDQIRAFDEKMLDFASRSDPAGWFAHASAIYNRWRVCGLAATYTMLHTIGPVQGKLLSYDQAVNPNRTCCVSFASIGYESTSSHG